MTVHDGAIATPKGHLALGSPRVNTEGGDINRLQWFKVRVKREPLSSLSNRGAKRAVAVV
jgi:hypothetical protein